MTAKTTIAIICFVIILLGGLFGMYFNYLNTNEILTEQVYNHLKTTAQSRAQHIEYFLDEQKDKIQTVATYQELTNEELKEIRDINEEFYELFVLNSNGKVIASSDESHIGLDRSTDNYFIHAKNKTYIKDAYYSETAEQYFITVSTPHSDGVLVAKIKLIILEDITTDKTGLGETGEVYIIDKEMVLITSSRFIENSILVQEVETENAGKCLEHIEKDVVGHFDKSISSFLNYRGEKVFGVHVYIPETQWCLLAEIDEAEVLGEIKERLLKFSIILSIVLIALIILIGLFIWECFNKKIKRYFLKIRSKKKKRKSRKNIFAFGIVFVVVFVIFGVFLIFELIPQETSGELNIYNWEDYFGETTIEDFEKEFGIKVNLVTFEDEYEILDEDTNLSIYDLIVISDDLAGDMIKSDLLAPIKKRNIPNLKYVDKKCVKESSEKYVVPYFFGTTGMAFNIKYIPEDTNSWDVLWNIEYSGKIGILNNPSEVIGMAAKYVGLPLVPQTEFQLRRVRQFLLLQKPLIENYKSETTILEELVSEELWAALIYDAMARKAMEENENIKFIIPKEGGAKWVDNFAIVKDSKNKYAAEVFINYILDLEVNKDITEYQISYSCNEEVMKSIDSELLERISENSLRFLEYFSDYNETEKIKKLKNDLWEELIRE